jgi:hypothetical protein
VYIGDLITKPLNTETIKKGYFMSGLGWLCDKADHLNVGKLGMYIHQDFERLNVKFGEILLCYAIFFNSCLKLSSM